MPVLIELALKSAAKNERLGVTGFVNYDAAFQTFFQFLEGEKDTVEQLIQVIECDPRHRVLSRVPILEHERQAAIARTSRSAGLDTVSGRRSDVSNMANEVRQHRRLPLYGNRRLAFRRRILNEAKLLQRPPSVDADC